ncbi:pten, isoform E [Planoprotostelium fungivorum]|uniref:Phosphatidylinositol 3,4,5-trisphosphate 3-phosphatase and dual-specificity protein phosphatase PTEN n=1 Tax=Planoprotostelium fungivorum TaxID=1890364 RepID=A0A2P6ND01_9EUKA|nr:pten, isoform E [Planoprotostelium fungivorum]
MSSLIRGAVSKKKRRYQKHGFDLDLSYITKRIIAMGFPSDSMEGVYRNPWKKVFDFLELSHKDHYKIYNLCSERSYDITRFRSRVECFPFDDHNAPPFDLIHKFCINAHEWMQADPNNVIVVHCKAGKGRTGVMICAYMLYSQEWKKADDALSFYAAMRTYNQKGVTIPSQLRYIRYFASVVGNNPSVTISPVAPSLLLSRIDLITLPKVCSAEDVSFSVYMYKTLVYTFREPPKHPQKGKGTVLPMSDEEQIVSFVMPESLPLNGDLKFDFFQSNNHERLFAFWLNTGFIENNFVQLPKLELDKINKDKNHKSFDKNFVVRVYFNTPVDGKIKMQQKVRPPTIRPDERPPVQELETGVLNLRGISKPSQRSACDVSLELVSTILALYDAAPRAKDNQYKDFDSIRQLKDFGDFCLSTSELQTVNLENLDHPLRVSFWLNIYHTLCLHGYVLCASDDSTGTPFAAVPNTLKETLALHKHIKYQIGGLGAFSAADIHFGILKSRTMPSSHDPTARSGGFLAAQRLAPIEEGRLSEMLGDLPVNPIVAVVALTTPVPRISLGINLGTKHSPRIRVFQPLTVFDELEKAARTLAKDYIEIDNKEKKVILPELLEWNVNALGGQKNMMMDFIGYLPKEERENVNSKYSVEYLPHDATFSVVLQYGKSSFLNSDVA